MGLKVLCTGDIHIGRQLTKVEKVYRTADAWKAIVELAVQEDVDLLALSGDVIDAASKSYEAYGPLQDGLATLASAGIDTVAVAGNHDFDVLPRIAEHAGTERFHLLGRNGDWERFTLRRDGKPVLHVDGWSFPSEHVTDSPLRDYPDLGHDGIPGIGLLHGDVGVALSHYAPIRLSDFWPLDMRLLVLGHIHASEVFSDLSGKKAVYVGSPWAMDRGEPGAHGAWMVDIQESGAFSLDQIMIAPVRYVSHVIDASDIEDEDAFQQHLFRTLTQIGQEAISDHGKPYLETVSLRLHFTGESTAHRLFPAWVARASSEIGHVQVGSITVCPEWITSDVRPRVNLDVLSKGNDPIADTARLIIALETPDADGEYQDLVASALREMQAVYWKNEYNRLRQGTEVDEVPTEADARMVLQTRAWEMLSMLVDQRQGA